MTSDINGKADMMNGLSDIEKTVDSVNSKESGSSETTSTGYERDTWAKKIDFLFSCVGFAVGLGNIWRFPYLCYKNGGGAFFIPYLICLFCGGIPVLLLEVGLGQFMRKGGLNAWNICPLFKGIGVATIIVDVLVNSYYIIILAWAVYFLVSSFTSILPWSHCDNPWNTQRCALQSAQQTACIVSANGSEAIYKSTEWLASNETYQLHVHNCTYSNISTVDPVVEFWERKVLQISSGIDESGGVIWELALCLLFVWVVVYFCIWRGVKWTGKIVYFTASFPYVMILILLVRGLTLEGAWIGVKYYLKPDFSRLSDPQVWIDGGTQIFYSYAIAMGAMICLGSYNKFNHDFYRDCLIISFMNTGTSIVAGFVVFSVLGFMSVQQNVDISVVADSGPGLVFVAYPKAVTYMPLPPLWACLFFLMLILVGLDSQFVAAESLITHISDVFPRQLYPKKGRMIFVFFYCVLSFLIGLSMITKGGMYVFQIFDYYTLAGFVALWLCFWESFVIGWVYGCENFFHRIQLMIGYRINIWFKICWKFVTPAVTLAIFLFHIIKFTPLTYSNDYKYPSWALGMGTCLSIVSMICVPLVFCYQVGKGRGNILQRLTQAREPVFDADHPYLQKEMNLLEDV